MNNPYRLMVIDDDVTMLKSIEKILIDNDYSVSISKSGEQAIAAINKGIIPDLILLDIAMPKMNGYETYRKIKEIRDIPVIFLTSMEDMQAELQGLELGAIDYITKPFVTDILLARIKNHLKNISSYTAYGSKNTDVISFDEEKIVKLSTILTETELKVAKQIALGYTNQEIADKYSYSYTYVKKLAYRIFDKLQINKRNELRSHFISENKGK